ncbi:MAG: hypothetical protein GYB15_00540 [Gammaproteobacteria bacterium]|nr:hypothetical protein [Gammaproteobacteria bacterium]
MGTSDDIGQAIFAYRSFDLRDRFPQPLETFREALACLQSDDAYMAAMSGEIIAYLRAEVRYRFLMTFSFIVQSIVLLSWVKKKMMLFA